MPLNLACERLLRRRDRFLEPVAVPALIAKRRLNHRNGLGRQISSAGRGALVRFVGVVLFSFQRLENDLIAHHVGKGDFPCCHHLSYGRAVYGFSAQFADYTVQFPYVPVMVVLSSTAPDLAVLPYGDPAYTAGAR